jgi:hypothetical protein
VRNKIADGHDNAAGLLELWQLDPPKFRMFRGDLLTEWSDAEGGFVRNGLGEMVPIGLPTDTWIFFRLTRDELRYLQTEFGTEVTIYTLDKGRNTWTTFNATLLTIRIMGQGTSSARWEMDEWFDVRMEFVELVEIS